MRVVTSGNHAPSRWQSFKEALAFLHGHLNLDDGDQILGDRLLRGLAWRALQGKRERRQAPPLPVQAVRALEEHVVANYRTDPASVVQTGFLLFCVFGRLRFGDAARVSVQPTLDVVQDARGSEQGYVEVPMLRHKTDGPTPSLPLPVAAPIRGVCGHAWASAWVKARATCGCVANDQVGLVQRRTKSGQWEQRPMRTSEGTDFLRRTLAGTLNGTLSADQIESFTAHSLKATALSWCAKRGVAAGLRRLLGYHVKPKDKSPATYARDAMAEPLRALESVVKDINSGVFSRCDANREACRRSRTQRRRYFERSVEPRRSCQRQRQRGIVVLERR